MTARVDHRPARGRAQTLPASALSTRSATRVRPRGTVAALWVPSPTGGEQAANGRNKQGTSNCGIQHPTTIISTTWIHARSGQPLAVTLNGTVRGLTYKQEAGGSSPSPPIAQSLQMRRFEAFLCRCCAAGNKQLILELLNHVRMSLVEPSSPASGISLPLPPPTPDGAWSLLVPSDDVVSRSRGTLFVRCGRLRHPEGHACSSAGAGVRAPERGGARLHARGTSSAGSEGAPHTRRRAGREPSVIHAL